MSDLSTTGGVPADPLKKVRRSLLFCSGIVAWILVGSIGAHAGTGIWTSHGPPHDQCASSIALVPTAPNTIYATCGGLFMSIDGGLSWAAIMSNIRIASVIAVDPRQPSTLYAGSNDGMLKSTNAGLTWQRINEGLTVPHYLNVPIQSLAIDPIDTNTVYAGTGGGLGLFKTTDGGASWRAIDAGLPENNLKYNVMSLAVDPAHSNVVFLGTRFALDGGVFRSIDGGASWQAVNDGVPVTSDGSRYVDSVAIDPLNPTTVYAATVFNGVIKSENGGDSWFPINDGLTGSAVGYIVRVAVDPVHPSTLYAGSFDQGVFRSTNAGGSWTQISEGFRPSTNDSDIVSLAVSTSGTAYVGTWSGLVYAYAAGNGSVCGDADANGTVTVTDGVGVLRAAAGLGGSCSLASCDVDGSGAITVSDGVNVLRAAAGLPTTLHCSAVDAGA